MQVRGAAPETFDTDLVIEPLTDAEAAAAADDVPVSPSTAEPPPRDADESPQGVWQTLAVFAVVIGGWLLIRLVRRRPRAADGE